MSSHQYHGGPAAASPAHPAAAAAAAPTAAPAPARETHSLTDHRNLKDNFILNVWMDVTIPRSQRIPLKFSTDVVCK